MLYAMDTNKTSQNHENNLWKLKKDSHNYDL